jgi:hypothetical protein
MSKNIRVEAGVGDGGLIDWEIDGKKPKESKIDFEKGSGPVTVEFKLQDRTDRELHFNTANPIWVHENELGQCPPDGATDNQIAVQTCDDKTLTLINKNEKASTLRYQLNFVDKANQSEPCDPEFKNGGTNLL